METWSDGILVLVKKQYSKTPDLHLSTPERGETGMNKPQNSCPISGIPHLTAGASRCDFRGTKNSSVPTLRLSRKQSVITKAKPTSRITIITKPKASSRITSHESRWDLARSTSLLASSA